MSHVKLGKIPNNWLQWEINESLKYIKKLQGSIDIYALPYGNYDSFSYNVIRSLTMNKIKYIFSTIGLVNDYNNILLGRSFILNSDSVFYLKGLINGSMNLFEKLLFIPTEISDSIEMYFSSNLDSFSLKKVNFDCFLVLWRVKMRFRNHSTYILIHFSNQNSLKPL